MSDEKPTQQWTVEEKIVVEADPQVCAAHFSACGKFLLAGGFDSRVRRWRLDEEALVEWESYSNHKAWVGPVISTADLAFSADSWGAVAAWDYQAEKPEQRWHRPDAHDGWCRQLAIADGILASCGRDQTIRLWNSDSGEPAGELQGHSADIYCIAFSPNDATVLVSGDAHGVIKVWNVKSMECTGELDGAELFMLHRLQDVGGVKWLEFDAAGQRVAAAGTKPKNGATVQGEPMVVIFDLASGEKLHSVSLGPTKDCYVHELRFWADDMLLAVTSGTPGSGRLIMQRIGEEEPLYASTKLVNCHSLSLSPDRSTLAVTTTNRNSNGNGRRLNKEGEYVGNVTPIHLLTVKDSAG